MTRREVELLCHLATHPRQTFSRHELLRTVWRSSSDWQSEATVTEHVRRLRTKIEAGPLKPTRIITLRGIGYRFEPTGDGSVGCEPGAARPR